MEYLIYKCMLLISVINGISSAQTENPKVHTDVGEIVGTSHTVTVDKKEYTVNKYLGIPYGQPPVGERRFLKAVPIDKLTSPFVADKFGAACPQTDMPYLPKPSSMSEDCLFLNVFVPNRDPESKSGFAVMVFIYGGGFQYGSSESYGGGTLAAYGNVIIVTINYRIGIMGFLSTGDGHAPGNMGLWDQHLALQWVHNNVGAFGGDNGRVTVFGESAGSISAVCQGLHLGNKDLVHRIIAQSGTPAIKSLINANPLQSTQAFADFFNCSKESTKEMMDCLRKIDSVDMFKEINAAIASDPAKAVIFTHQLVIDGDFLQTDPSDFVRTPGKGKQELKFYRSLDLIMGVNSHEGVVGLTWLTGEEDLETFETSREKMDTKFIPSALAVAGETAKELTTKLIKSEYTDWTNPDDPKTLRNELVRLVGDSIFTVGAVEYAQLHCKETEEDNTFFYVFSANMTNTFLPTPSWVNGANHGDEIGFVFGFDEETIRDLKKVSTFVWQEPEDWEWEVSLKIMRYWSTFAKIGTPNRADEGYSKWPKYDIENQRALNINKEINTIGFVYAREFNFWKHIIPEVNRILAGYAQTSDQDACYAGGECDGK